MAIWKNASGELFDDMGGDCLNIEGWASDKNKLTQDEVNEMLAPSADDLANNIRAERNAKLDIVDKKINKLEDNGQDATAFRKYRQALRDVPEQTGFPNNVTWPSEPI